MNLEIEPFSFYAYLVDWSDDSKGEELHLSFLGEEIAVFNVPAGFDGEDFISSLQKNLFKSALVETMKEFNLG